MNFRANPWQYCVNLSTLDFQFVQQRYGWTSWISYSLIKNWNFAPKFRFGLKRTVNLGSKDRTNWDFRISQIFIWIFAPNSCMDFEKNSLDNIKSFSNASNISWSLLPLLIENVLISDYNIKFYSQIAIWIFAPKSWWWVK